MFEDFLCRFAEWAAAADAIDSAILVGSYARGTHTPSSDIDLVVLTPYKDALIEKPDFPLHFGAVAKEQTEYYGTCTSIRVWYENGLEVEFGLVEPTWIELPLVRGTQQVLSGGYRVLVDKKKTFQNPALPPSLE